MKMKLVANLLVAIHNVAAAEAIVLAVKSGLDAATAYRVISAGAGASRMLDLRGPLMVEGRYEPPTMKVDVWQKDMALIGEFAAEVAAPTPLFAATVPLYAAAMDQGFGEPGYRLGLRRARKHGGHRPAGRGRSETQLADRREETRDSRGSGRAAVDGQQAPTTLNNAELSARHVLDDGGDHIGHHAVGRAGQQERGCRYAVQLRKVVEPPQRARAGDETTWRGASIIVAMRATAAGWSRRKSAVNQRASVASLSAAMPPLRTVAMRSLQA